MRRGVSWFFLFLLTTAAYCGVLDGVVRDINLKANGVETILIVQLSHSPETNRVVDRLREAFARVVVPGKTPIRLLDRDNLKRYLNELKLKESDLVDSTHGPELGKILAADAFLYVTVRHYRKGAWGEDVDGSLRLVKVETGEELYANQLTGIRLSYVGWATYYALFAFLLILILAFFFAFRKRRVMGDRIGKAAGNREDALIAVRTLGRLVQDRLSASEKSQQAGWLSVNRALDDLANQLQNMAGGSEQQSRKKDVKRYGAIWKETASLCDRLSKKIRKEKVDLSQLTDSLRDLASRMM